jgi:flagellar FliJ protein
MKSCKLQAVLDHRQRIEDQARQALAQAIQHEHLLMSKVTDETGALAEICRTYEQRQTVGMQGHEFVLYENSISYTRQVLLDLDRQLGEARQQVVQARQLLAEASR